jgi:hypothetical protein
MEREWKFEDKLTMEGTENLYEMRAKQRELDLWGTYTFVEAQ